MLPWTLKMSWGLWEETHKDFVGYWPESVCSVLPTVDLSYMQNPGLSPKQLVPLVKGSLSVLGSVWESGKPVPLTMALTAFGPAPPSSTSAFFGVCDSKLMYTAVSLEAVGKGLGCGGWRGCCVMQHLDSRTGSSFLSWVMELPVGR